MARQAVRGGLAQCALALGFEKMEKGSLGVKYTDRTNPIDKHLMTMFEVREPEQSPFAPQMFGNAGREHMERYGSEPDHYAWIGWKNHKHSVNNPFAQFQDEYSLEDIKAAKMIHEPLTKLQCSPTSDGSACAVVASERFVDEHDLWDRAVEIAGQAMVTDMRSTFEERSSIKIVGYDMSKEAADRAYEEAGVAAEDVDVVELHDCFSANELITYEALGLAEEGEGHKLVEAEDTTYGGRWVVNPSGGLISKGHPLGATGLAQCSELTWQLRGDGRQAPGRGREGRPAAQHRARRGGRRVRVQARCLAVASVTYVSVGPGQGLPGPGRRPEQQEARDHEPDRDQDHRDEEDRPDRQDSDDHAHNRGPAWDEPGPSKREGGADDQAAAPAPPLVWST